jgi:chromosomal replication initiation ATPase DnaA
MTPEQIIETQVSKLRDELTESWKNFDKIEDIACEIMGVGKDRIRGKCRETEFTWARYFVWSAMIKKGVTYDSIGMVYNRCHSAVLHGLQRVKKLRSINDKEFTTLYGKFTEAIEGL